MLERLAAVTLAAVLLPPAPAGAAEWSATAAVTSEYVFRGVSQSDRHGALQGGVAVRGASGLFAGLWASSADLTFGLPEGQARKLELQIAAGYRAALSPAWSAEATLLRYAYPGSFPGRSYDYLEGAVAIRLRDTARLSVAYTDDAFGGGRPALTADLLVSWPLARDLRGVTGWGTYRPAGGFAEPYDFWSVGLARGLGPVALELLWIDTDSTAERLFGDRAGGRLVITMTATLPGGG